MTTKTTKQDALSPEFIQDMVEGSLAVDEEKQAKNLNRIYRWIKRFADPQIIGADNIPDGPVLFVGNHSTMAADVLVVVPALQQACGRFVRGMSDEIMYRNPRMRKNIVNAGAVMGNQEVGSALLAAGKDLLVFPGGAYEANKDLEERYTIQWKKRTGFVRLAASHGVPIVPVGIVGPDEWFGRYMDRDQVRTSMLGKLMRAAGASDEFMESDQVPPIPRGMFGTLLPRPQRVYIGIGKPIATARFKGKAISTAAQGKIRDASRNELETIISHLLLLQAQNKESEGLVRKLLSL